MPKRVLHGKWHGMFIAGDSIADDDEEGRRLNWKTFIYKWAPRIGHHDGWGERAYIKNIDSTKLQTHLELMQQQM